MTEPTISTAAATSPAPGPEDARCKDCGVVLDPGTAKVFTVCDACWGNAYRKPARSPDEDAAALERKMITQAWDELLALTKGHPHASDILGVVHVLRANERRLGRVIQQQFAALVKR